MSSVKKSQQFQKSAMNSVQSLYCIENVKINEVKDFQKHFTNILMIRLPFLKF